ncbi:MAG: transcription-repair coupling factor [Candidatus Zixiibacteriota bacterium]
MVTTIHKNVTTALRSALTRTSTFGRLIELAEPQRRIEIAGLAGSANAFLISELQAKLKSTVVVVAPFEKLAANIAGDLQELCGEDAISVFPAWDVYAYDWIAPPVENIAQRLETIWKLASGKPLIIVTTPDALQQKTLTKSQLGSRCFDLKIGDEFDLPALAARLVQLGYERMPVTEEVGTFSVRGGIVDIFPFTTANPIRCEFFGDFIDSIRFFSVLSQRSIEPVKLITIIPRREILIEQTALEEYVDLFDPSTADLIREKCLNGFDQPGLEWLAPLLEIEQSSLFDHLPDNALFYLTDQPLIEDRFESLLRDSETRYAELYPTFPKAPTPAQVFVTEKLISQNLESRRQIVELALGASQDSINFGFKEHPSFNGQISILREMIEGWLKEEKSVFLLSDNQLQRDRLVELLPEFAERISFGVSGILKGFVIPETQTIVLTDHQIFERQVIRHRRRKFKEGQAISSYNALDIGDYIVHVDYGIGRYRGLKEIKIDNRKRECLLVVYADDDKLYVPIEEFARVQKYVGKDGAPQLTKLGGKSWEKVKARTKKAIADMAEELIALYAARKAKPGMSFPPDDDWMRQLEASFPFEETADQLTAIDSVKKDMMQPSPMDRLICGDVGFGKTEVAIRAALKAVAGGKQVAVLVPTTILAQQHLETFRRRLGQFPMRIEMLSRFRSRLEQKETISQLHARNVDIIIGTHRLLQKDLQIPNLGLIIVDEEQRFGVAHKERLKHIRQTADCLTLTATPIPRTLQMSLLGARDMSLINTSPKDRQSIVTEIAEFDAKIIYEAINFEVARKGQVYFVHNRVESIESMHRYLVKLLPHIRVAVGHGQMHEHELEKVMLGFLHKDYDVLLSSAIIESGIDIPSVNTIIINRADRFGLAQLYQLRGRVGRSQQRAFAYLLVPPVKQLTDTARKRLKAIEQHTDLGSGFHLAMKDLEIRGAGNMLGPQQHGFIEEVGFDLYCRLLEEAVAELKGETADSDFEVKLEVDCDTFIPEAYIEESKQRVDIYRKIADAKSAEELDMVVSELVDRFGKFGEETQNLIDLMALNIAARKLRIGRVRINAGRVTLSYGDGESPTKSQIEKLRMAAPDRLEFDSSHGFVIKTEFPESEERPIGAVRKLLLALSD